MIFELVFQKTGLWRCTNHGVMRSLLSIFCIFNADGSLVNELRLMCKILPLVKLILSFLHLGMKEIVVVKMMH